MRPCILARGTSPVAPSAADPQACLPDPLAAGAAAARPARSRSRRGAAIGGLVLAATLAVAGCGGGAAPTGLASGPAAVTIAASGTSTTQSSAAAQPAPGAGLAQALQQQFVDVVRKVNPSVVVIENSTGLGSGIVFDTRGDIVTNAHVAAGSSTYKVTLADGRTFDGRLVGSFTGDDLAVIHIDASGLQPATFADSSKLVVGDIVLALGNPLGLQSSVTEGIVSALGRTVSEANGVALPNTIQTSAPINPGNSGGALVDLSGSVVGIPTLAASDPQMGGAATGIGFAIASNTVTDIANQLIANGKVTNSHRAYLGVMTVDALGAPGAVVYSVAAGSPAAAAGIARGEAITSVGGKPTPDSAALADVLAGLTPGQSVAVALARSSGSTSTVSVTLGQLPG